MEKLTKEFAKFNIDTFGICDAALYNNATNTDYKCCIVVLFPYFCGYKDKSNLSIYAHGADYHLVTRRILTAVAENCGLSDYKVHADTGPYIERELAVSAGVAFMGRNGLCINPNYGSYFFIGYIVCNEEYEFSNPRQDACMSCRLCVSSCPGGALSDGFCEGKCLSAITQKKGELTLEETELVRNHNTVFGCDICQRVCPHNRDISKTPISDFSDKLITELSYENIKDLSEREFKRIYADRAFSWRGLKPILRNLICQRGESKNEDINT